MSKLIMYHYIQNYKKEFPDLNFLHKKNFIKQINYFSKTNKLFSISEKFEIQKKINNKIILTFDDGLKSHLNVAKYLNSKNICGIFSIPTKHLMENDFLDIHKLHLIFAKYTSKEVNNIFQKKIDTKKLVYLKKKNIFNHFQGQRNLYNAYNLNSEIRKKIFIKTQINYYSNYDKNVISNIFNYFFSKAEQRRIFLKFYLNKNDIKKISRLGMIISSHSHSHKNINLLNLKNQFEDIKTSKKILEKLIAKKIFFFTYPYGGKNTYNSKTIKYLKKLNFKYALTVKNKNFSRNDNNFEVPRYDCNLFKYGKVVKKNV